MHIYIHTNLMYNVPINMSLELAVPDFVYPSILQPCRTTFPQTVNIEGGHTTQRLQPSKHLCSRQGTKADFSSSSPASIINSILLSGTCFTFCTKRYQELFSNWSLFICQKKCLLPMVSDCRGLSTGKQQKSCFLSYRLNKELEYILQWVQKID